MTTEHSYNFLCVTLFMVMILQALTRDEDLFRLIDKHIVCDSRSSITNVTVHSLSNCAMACKTKAKCLMFSLDHIYRDQSIYKSKKSKMMTCTLCKSTNVTTFEEKRGWSTYMKWFKEIRFNTLDTDNKASPPKISPLETWNIDCNAPSVTSKRNGIIIGIWDDRDGFRDLDRVKCFNWDAAELFSEKPSRLLYIHLEDYRQCPKDYVLTAGTHTEPPHLMQDVDVVSALRLLVQQNTITASNAAFRNVDNGKCTPLLPQYHVDYEQCVTVSSEGKDGGSVDKWRPWQVQCPTAGPMVAVSLHRRRRIHTGLKCCVLKGLVPE